MIKYTIRVYAIILNKQNEVLLLNESYNGIDFTKFPGGGMEKGEGTLDCLHRELKEELDLCDLDLNHFYTTDFYVESAFSHQTQVLSIYYKSKTTIKESDISFDSKDPKLKGYKFVPLNELSENDLTFPIDKKVTGLLASH